MQYSQEVVVALAVCSVVAILRSLRKLRPNVPKGLKLPPGPPGRFLIGNLTDIPIKENWKTFQHWANTYGDFTYLNIFGTSLLFVNSFKLQNELFDQRGLIYSDRFESKMLHDLSGFDWSVTTLQYGEHWRRHRGVLHHILNKSTLVKYRGVLERHTTTLLLRLFESPEKFLQHSRHTLGAVIMELTYGIKVLSENDPYVETAENAARIIGEVSQPGAFYVDFLPILKYVPSWFPGAGFQRKAKELNRHLQDMVHLPYNKVKELMKTGKAEPSIVSNFLEELQTRQDVTNYEEEEEILRYVSGVIYLGGIDTTESVFQSFFLAMILYPEVQRIAQKELDDVVGQKALPSFEDRPNLPYVEGVFKEALRWHPVAPCGFPHLLKEDDVIGEYFIPKGTVVMGNIWALLHSSSCGEDVDDFNPARYMQSDVKDPDLAFGFGRRVCPGRWMADNELFIMIASVLHAFKIEPYDGEILNRDHFVPGVISRPKPFKCRISPRTPETEFLLRQLSEAHDYLGGCIKITRRLANTSIRPTNLNECGVVSDELEDHYWVRDCKTPFDHEDHEELDDSFRKPVIIN